ncbi:ATP-binding protein [Leptolyngbya sp. FACHB-261]|uniref:ATP-binding protein n=1 Tax=Leptolyngbya sp. FACHB-261 TaxID=2692806 RepID=UPI0016851DF5|nr:ATP-binding protein [Leptolyngbya sp. FACHB-261]MBD2101099.1 histidine kinase [Leptolyngbya sp. FACHB-261]
MSQTLPPHASLYELVLNQTGTVAEPLQISSRTLMSACRLLMDLLIERRAPALVCAKLPGSFPQLGEIERYQNLAESASQLYLFSSAEGTSEEGKAKPATNGLEALDSTEELLEGLIDLPQLTWVRLPAAHRLSREDFLLILCSEFAVLLLAHHPRTDDETLSPLPVPAPSLSQLASTASTASNKRVLLTLCSFDMTTVRNSLDGLRPVLLEALPASTRASAIQTWDELVTELAPQPGEVPELVSSLVTGLLAQQEELSQEGTALRQQADVAEELRLRNEELLNSLRLKDEFLSLVAQELRTPITNMKTALSLIQAPALKPPQRQRYMKVLSDECVRQGSLVNGLVALVNLDQGLVETEIRPLNLAEIVPGLASTYQPVALEKGIVLTYAIPTDLPTVLCHSSDLRQIVINLIDNSIKFTPFGGRVWVRARAQGEYVQLEVRDTGVGIPPQELPRIFDRFYRVRTSMQDTGGVGLGLAIVQRLLLRCGGSVTVRSREGEGSNFSVLLPVHNPSEA